MAKKKASHKMQAWIDARKRHHLSHVQVQMARELGMNPKKLGKKDNHDQIVALLGPLIARGSRPGGVLRGAADVPGAGRLWTHMVEPQQANRSVDELS